MSKKEDTTVNYGSIEEGDKSFDAKEMQYLGETKLTQEQKMKKLMRIAVPLLLAVLIVGGAFLFLAKDFGHLYPGRGADHGTKVVHTNSGPEATTTAAATTTTTTKSQSKIPEATSVSSTSSSSSSSSSAGAKCSAHDGCADLTGYCCLLGLKLMMSWAPSLNVWALQTDNDDASSWHPGFPKKQPPHNTILLHAKRMRCTTVKSFLVLFQSVSLAWLNVVPTRRQSLTRLEVGNIFGSDTKAQPALPRDVKEAVSKCRSATQEALKNRVSRMDIEFPVGAKFNVEPQTKRKGSSSGDNAPTTADLQRSDRELARLFVDMFQPVGGEQLTVVFRDVAAADAAKKKWKGDSTAQCRIVSLDRRKSASPKKKGKAKGFAAKMAAEIEDNGESVGGPFKLPQPTEVALFVSPGSKELVIVERICEEVGMGTLVVLLNARLSTIRNFGTASATDLFANEFESVFHLAAFQPQEAAPNCLLHRAYPGKWILARKPSVGAPKTFLVAEGRPTADEAAAAFDKLEISDVEKGVEDMVQNVAGWFK